MKKLLEKRKVKEESEVKKEEKEKEVKVKATNDKVVKMNELLEQKEK